MFTLGVPEMVVIFILALVLFGPKKLPELGRTIGKAMTEFRRASNDLKATFEREMHTIEQENRAIQATTRETVRELADHASYGLAPAETMWNPLQQAVEEALNPDTPSTPDNPRPETPQETAQVGASEVSGAESTGIEGTVARSTTPAEPAQELAEAAPESKSDAPAHS